MSKSLQPLTAHVCDETGFTVTWVFTPVETEEGITIEGTCAGLNHVHNHHGVCIDGWWLFNLCLGDNGKSKMYEAWVGYSENLGVIIRRLAAYEYEERYGATVEEMLDAELEKEFPTGLPR